MDSNLKRPNSIVVVHSLRSENHLKSSAHVRLMLTLASFLREYLSIRVIVFELPGAIIVLTCE
jgi:hypothetical protein